MENENFQQKGWLVQRPWCRKGHGCWWNSEEASVLEQSKKRRPLVGQRDGLKSAHVGPHGSQKGGGIYSESNGEPWRVCEPERNMIGLMILRHPLWPTWGRRGSVQAGVSRVETRARLQGETKYLDLYVLEAEGTGATNKLDVVGGRGRSTDAAGLGPSSE